MPSIGYQLVRSNAKTAAGDLLSATALQCIVSYVTVDRVNVYLWKHFGMGTLPAHHPRQPHCSAGETGPVRSQRPVLSSTLTAPDTLPKAATQPPASPSSFSPFTMSNTIRISISISIVGANISQLRLRLILRLSAKCHHSVFPSLRVSTLLPNLHSCDVLSLVHLVPPFTHHQHSATIHSHSTYMLTH